jgi:Uncharacterized protein conserved in bacteria
MAKTGYGHFPQVGIVTKVNLKNQTAAVWLPLEQMETDFLRISSNYVGTGWGMTQKLNVRDEVLVIPLGGDLRRGIISARLFSEESDPPPKEAAEDFVMTHKNGSKLIFKSDGSVLIQSTGNMMINAGGNMTIQSGGNMTIKGSQINLN